MKMMIKSLALAVIFMVSAGAQASFYTNQKWSLEEGAAELGVFYSIAVFNDLGKCEEAAKLFNAKNPGFYIGSKHYPGTTYLCQAL